MRALRLALLCLALATAAGAIDLSPVRVERLDNGLTVLVLEERTLPVVSVQMLYKIGARNEAPGTTGVAHFLEHMAFRATEEFPENDVVRRIYAVGGEWHGYTWIDQTTYFATVPSEHLDLLLDIEAQRMGALVIDPADVEAERGSVMAELRGYEEDPATVLTETVPQVAFLQHPYRYNSIGWPSDVLAIEHTDLVDFYRRHYHPANAVLAIVGDVDPPDVLRRVRDRFGSLPGRPPTPLPRTVEPPQRGERRVTLRGDVDRSLFEIGYRAPAVSSADWPGFLVLQEILGGGAGVNFLQDTFGVAVHPDTRLAGITDETWLIASALPYVLTVSGSVDPGGEAALETRVEAALRGLREDGVGEDELAAALRRVRAELVFDLETTEDAAHQLAWFAGLDALDVLLDLERRLDDVTPADVRDLARRYLTPHQRTVAWYVPELELPASDSPTPDSPTSPTEAQAEPESGSQSPTPEPDPPAGTMREAPTEAKPLVGLAGSIPLVLQRSALSPAAHLRLVLPGRTSGADVSPDDPAWDHSSITQRVLATELPDAVAGLRRQLDEVDPTPAVDEPSPFEAALERAAGVTRRRLGSRQPRALIVTGDLDAAEAVELIERSFGAPGAAPASGPEAPGTQPGPVVVPVPGGTSISVRTDSGGNLPIEHLPPRASGRARLGYAVGAPTPSSRDALAWQALLYILTHGYEGRLGHAAIHERGLVYYIDSAYRSDGEQGWVSFQASVEPARLAELTNLVIATLSDLSAHPPTDEEVAEAKRHMLGRRVSAAQSNEEISARLARDLVWYGAPLAIDELAKRLERLTTDDVRRVVPALLSGRLVVESVETDP